MQLPPPAETRHWPEFKNATKECRFANPRDLVKPWRDVIEADHSVYYSRDINAQRGEWKRYLDESRLDLAPLDPKVELPPPLLQAPDQWRLEAEKRAAGRGGSGTR